MNLYPHRRSFQRVLFRFVLMLGLTIAVGATMSSSWAAGGLGATARARLRAQCELNQTPHYLRTINPSRTRVVLDITNPLHREARNQIAIPGSNVLEVCHAYAPDSSHTMVLFEGRPLHFQYKIGTDRWRLRSWGPLDLVTDLHGVMVQLSRTEGDRLRHTIQLAEQEQGPEFSKGMLWENGHLRTEFGGSDGNCVSKWADAKLGPNKSLAQVCGLPSNWSPRSFQSSLEREGNSRVFGVWTKGGPSAGDQFLATQGQDLF